MDISVPWEPRANRALNGAPLQNFSRTGVDAAFCAYVFCVVSIKLEFCSCVTTKYRESSALRQPPDENKDCT